MVGMLDYLLANNPFGRGAPGGFDALDASAAAAALPQNESEAAQEALKLAARRQQRQTKRPVIAGPLALDAQPVPGVGEVGSLLSGMTGLGGASGWNDMPPPPSTNDPMSAEPKPDPSIPLPRPRPDAPGAPLSLAPPETDGDALPQGATSTEGRAPVAAVPAAAAAAPGLFSGGAKGILDKIFDPNKAATMLALGAGFSGAPSLGTGMRRAFSNAVPAMAADRAQIQKQTSIQSTIDALRAKGVPMSEAIAAAQNPEIMKATAAKYFEAKARVPHEIGTDWLGNKIMGSFDPNNGKFYDSAGKEIGGAAGGADAAGGAIPGGMMSTPLAKGTKEYNAELPADEYLAQFSPEVRAGIESYVNGDTMPTSNPRLKGFGTKVKEWAQLYGSKAGIPVSDSEFSRKRTMQNQIASSAPNSMGGILSNGKSAFGHLAGLAETFVDLGNRSGPDVPGGSWAGRAANYTGNKLLPTPETSGKLEAVRDNAGKYGAEATKFYAGTGGGVEERLSALHGIANPGSLATEQAAYLKTEKGLMLERLHQKESQIRDVMGDKYLEQHPVRTPDLQKSIDKIDNAIKKLESGNVGGHPPAEAGPKLKAGESTTINGVTIKRLN